MPHLTCDPIPSAGDTAIMEFELDIKNSLDNVTNHTSIPDDLGDGTVRLWFEVTLPNDTYAARARAKNKWGVSAYSEWSVEFTVDQPPVPNNVRLA